MSDAGHAGRMDAIYATQRHFYDLTRKYYLLGRDRLIDRLAVPPGGSVLEVGCGTGRNLAAIGRRYPDARLFGLDISAEMLKSARRSLTRARIGSRTMLAQADATQFDPAALFGRARFDRVVFSYTLSMIPDWQGALRQGVRVLAPAGELHLVDFGQFDGLPGWFGTGMRGWLDRFHVTPRHDLGRALAAIAAEAGRTSAIERPFRGYAVAGQVR